MTPLTKSSLKNLLERISFASEGEIRSLTPLTPTSIFIRFSVQDMARGYDWIDIGFRIEGVSDAKLLSDNALKVVSMEEGIRAEIENGRCGLAIGAYEGRLNEAPLYIIGTSIGYEELPFSG